MGFLNTLNRVVIVVVCLVLMAAFTALFLLPHVALPSVGRWMADWGDYFANQEPWTRLGIGITLAAVVDLVFLAIIFIEVRRPRSRYIQVQQVAGGMATISIESVTEMLQHRLNPLPGVIRITPTIRAKGNKVDAHVDVGVSPGTNVPQAASRLIAEIQSVLTDELGMQIAGVPSVLVNVLELLDESADANGCHQHPSPSPVSTPTPPPLPPALPTARKTMGNRPNQSNGASNDAELTPALLEALIFASPQPVATRNCGGARKH